MILAGISFVRADGSVNVFAGGDCEAATEAGWRKPVGKGVWSFEDGKGRGGSRALVLTVTEPEREAWRFSEPIPVEPGTVYLRAYVDQNNNGKRDSWESWGYVNSVGESVAAIYNPVGAEVVDSLVQFPTCTIYIEDCDLNGNEIPDCLESEKFTGGGESSGALDGDKDGLTDDEENGFGTDPTLWDTDGDGMPDGWEMNFAGLDPRFYDADEVTDMPLILPRDRTLDSTAGRFRRHRAPRRNVPPAAPDVRVTIRHADTPCVGNDILFRTP